MCASRVGPNFIHLHQGAYKSSVGEIFKKKIECCTSIWNSKVLICMFIWTQWLLGTLKHTGGNIKRNEIYENHATFSAFAWIKCQGTLSSFYSIPICGKTKTRKYWWSGEYTQYSIIRNGDQRWALKFLINYQIPDADRFLILQGWALVVS